MSTIMHYSWCASKQNRHTKHLDYNTEYSRNSTLIVFEPPLKCIHKELLDIFGM